MRKVLWLAILAVPLIVVITLPARIVFSWLDVPEGVSQVRGTVWSGHAQWRQPGKGPLYLEWRWDSGSVWRWQARNDDTGLQGQWRPGGSGLNLSEVRGQVELSRIDLDYWLINTRPRGFLEIDIERADIAPDRPPEIAGRVIWRDARLEGALHEPLGEIVIDLGSDPGQQRARIESRQPAPVMVRGTIELGIDDYVVDLWLRASSERPDLASQIARMGEVQSDGQVRIHLRGALGW